MRLRRPVPIVLSCAAVALTGCGGSSLLDGNSASELQTSLSTVRAAIDDGRCSEARSAARDGLDRVEALPTSVDAELRDRLKQGFDELTDRVRTGCETTPTTTETTPTAPTITTDPVEPTDPTTTDDTVPTDPTTTDDTVPTDPTTTDDGPPTDPGPPGDDGGPGDDSGGVTPGVDGPGPGASERSAKPGKKDKTLRERFREAEKRARDYLRGQGRG
jgi:hypothetical protein